MNADKLDSLQATLLRKQLLGMHGQLERAPEDVLRAPEDVADATEDVADLGAGVGEEQTAGGGADLGFVIAADVKAALARLPAGTQTLNSEP